MRRFLSFFFLILFSFQVRAEGWLSARTGIEIAVGGVLLLGFFSVVRENEELKARIKAARDTLSQSGSWLTDVAKNRKAADILNIPLNRVNEERARVYGDSTLRYSWIKGIAVPRSPRLLS